MTPVDMTQYAELGRRPEMPLPAASAASAADRANPRLSIARRPAFDLPLTVPAAGGAAPQQAVENELDFDAGAPFDVPAFLRRQEG